jgi:hypothetical protein
MNFVAKNNRLVIVLEHGIPPEPITGRQGTPTLFVKFVDGKVTPVAMSKYSAEEIAEKMRKHSGFGRDFVEVEDVDKIDPYGNTRRESEPRHSITEMNFGHLGKKVSSPKTAQSIPPEQREIITKIASEMAKSMVKDILKEMGINKTVAVENTRGAFSSEESEPNHFQNVDETGGLYKNEKKKEFVCECGKVAKSAFGLMSHKKYCKKLKQEVV